MTKLLARIKQIIARLSPHKYSVPLSEIQMEPTTSAERKIIKSLTQLENKKKIENAIEMASYYSSPAFTPSLIGILESNLDIGMKISAVKTLGKIGDIRALDSLYKLLAPLTNENVDLVEEAVHAIRHINDPGRKPVLRKFLKRYKKYDKYPKSSVVWSLMIALGDDPEVQSIYKNICLNPNISTAMKRCTWSYLQPEERKDKKLLISILKSKDYSLLNDVVEQLMVEDGIENRKLLRKVRGGLSYALRAKVDKFLKTPIGIPKQTPVKTDFQVDEKIDLEKINKVIEIVQVRKEINAEAKERFVLKNGIFKNNESAMLSLLTKVTDEDSFIKFTVRLRPLLSEGVYVEEIWESLNLDEDEAFKLLPGISKNDIKRGLNTIELLFIKKFPKYNKETLVKLRQINRICSKEIHDDYSTIHQLLKEHGHFQEFKNKGKGAWSTIASDMINDLKDSFQSIRDIMCCSL